MSFRNSPNVPQLHESLRDITERLDRVERKGATGVGIEPIYISGGLVGVANPSPSAQLDVTGSINASVSMESPQFNASTYVQAPKVNTDLIGTRGGDDLGIGAGETANYMAGNLAGEHLWLGAEGNIYLVKSPNNWASGWAGRYETRLTPLSDGSLQIGTNSGNIEIGPKNTLWCHIYTDRGAFYFDEEINMGGGSTVRGNLSVNDWLGANTSPTTNIPVTAQQGTLQPTNDHTSYRALGNWGGGYGFAEGIYRSQWISPGGYSMEFWVNGRSNSWGTKAMTIAQSGAVTVHGALSKGSGSFRIPHPLPEMTDTHDLVHSFVESPQADNIYRGRVALVDGVATVDLDVAAGMTAGTFELLNRDLQTFTSNESGWAAVRGSVSGSTLTIEAQDADCVDEVSWLVVGERQDQHMYDTDWTDEDGRVIVEPERPDEDAERDAMAAEYEARGSAERAARVEELAAADADARRVEESAPAPSRGRTPV